MIVISLDQAMKTTGWCVFENKKIVDCGTFKVIEKADIGQRLVEFMSKISDLYNKYHFDHLVFEDIQQQHGDVSTYKKLAYVQSAIYIWCYEHNINCTVYAPSSWRKITGGNYGKKRDEQKKVAIDNVLKWYNIEVDSDTADAICIGKAFFEEDKNKKSAF